MGSDGQDSLLPVLVEGSLTLTDTSGHGTRPSRMDYFKRPCGSWQRWVRWPPSSLPPLSSSWGSSPAPKPKLWLQLGVVGDTERALSRTSIPVAVTRGLQSGLYDILQSDASGLDPTDLKTREARVTFMPIHTLSADTCAIQNCLAHCILHPSSERPRVARCWRRYAVDVGKASPPWRSEM